MWNVEISDITLYILKHLFRMMQKKERKSDIKNIRLPEGLLGLVLYYKNNVERAK